MAKALNLYRAQALGFAIVIASYLPTRAVAQETLFFADFRPMMMGADAAPDRQGYSVDIVREAARRLGRRVKTEYQPFARALRSVQSRADAIQVSVFRDPVREPNFLWIAHTHNEPIVFLTLNEPLNGLADARSLEAIGVERRSGLDNLLTSQGFNNLERVAKPSTNAIKLQAGRIDAWAAGLNAATWTWSRHGFTEALQVGPLGEREVYVAAGRAFPEEIAARYAEALAAMREDGAIEAIIARYVRAP